MNCAICMEPVAACLAVTCPACVARTTHNTAPWHAHYACLQRWGPYCIVCRQPFPPDKCDACLTWTRFLLNFTLAYVYLFCFSLYIVKHWYSITFFMLQIVIVWRLLVQAYRQAPCHRLRTNGNRRRYR